METLYSTSGFNSETSLSGRPHTPPYSPARTKKPAKRRLERSDSPASNAGSIHPADTDSPAKKAAKRTVPDNITVEELAEGDVGYITDIDVVYPEELEEVSEDGSNDDRNTATDISDSEATGLTRKLSRLRCGDDQEVDFEHLRRRRHLEKRNGTRNFKRSHSQTVKSETEIADSDGLDDHDIESTRRRLRRRVRGPREVGVAFEDLLRSSPEIGSRGLTPDGYVEEPSVTSQAEDDVMDVDDGK
ncbi:Hypothetical predicted protein [Lecanosticta acicola]|uniref:Uncharacterized protein n=1 Tax=Lecanosticta acicola TaxID=111012 RepID=A0AAI8Z3L0_9PEZI|nr:Hypothetical predicted protein [Lecanosticta acicola]